jgi:hypothetical protein
MHEQAGSHGSSVGLVPINVHSPNNLTTLGADDCRALFLGPSRTPAT